MTDFPEIDPASWDEPGCELGPTTLDGATTVGDVDPDHDLVDGQLPEEIGDDETDEYGDGLREALDADDPDPNLPPAEATRPVAHVDPLTGPFIKAAGYREGRDRDGGRGVTYVVLHTAEGARDEVELGNFFHGSTSGSSHGGAGQDGGYAGYVDYADTAWTNPPVSDNSDTLEICGFAGWSRATWLAHPKILETVAHWVAWRCDVRDIPVRRLSPAELRGSRGVCDHKTINDVFHASVHWDVGPGFPWDKVMGRAQQIAGGQAFPFRHPQIKKGSPRVEVIVEKGDTLAKIGSRYRCPVAIIKQVNDLARDVVRVGRTLQVVDLRPTVNVKHLTDVSEAWRDHKHVGKGGGIRVVESALDAEGLLPKHDAPGIWGPNNAEAYRKWQHELGFTGGDADGAVGATSLRKLGRRHAFKTT